MDRSEFLTYSASEPMSVLRRQFHAGETLYKDTPATLSSNEAKEDTLYIQYVLENAYSGYTYYDKTLFFRAFDAILLELQRLNSITPNHFMDLIHTHLSFISDGHLALSSKDHGIGFYQGLQTYVSDLVLVEEDGRLFDRNSGQQVFLDSTLQVFPTIVKNVPNAALIGIRSKSPVEQITIKKGNREEIIPVHRIQSKPSAFEAQNEERYEDDIATIISPSFVGDSTDTWNKFYEIGKKCRKFKHVIWDLSNNLGGNSELPKQFLNGLTGGFEDILQFLELKSTLVHAKEFGDIQDIPYHFDSIYRKDRENAGLFNGNLHVIINDMVASSAEIAIAWAASLRHVTFYGCNSLGIGRFGDLCVYYLPNSNITLWCPQKVFDTKIRETVGFEPDYWIDDPDVVSIVHDRIKSSG